MAAPGAHIGTRAPGVCTMASAVEAYSPAGVMLHTAAQVRKVASPVAACMMAVASAIHTVAGARSPAGAMIHMTGARAYSPAAGEGYMPAVLPLHRPYTQVPLPGW